MNKQEEEEWLEDHGFERARNRTDLWIKGDLAVYLDKTAYAEIGCYSADGASVEDALVRLEMRVEDVLEAIREELH